jgi:DNA-binding transcriptional regulator YdaS (Cro superfamily)
MNPADVLVEKFGGKSQAARMLGVSRQVVNYWTRTGEVPGKHIRHIIEVAKLHGIRMTEKDLIYGNDA